MKSDSLGFDLAVLDVDLVATQHYRDVLTDSDKIPMPVGNVLVRYPRGHVKHDDSTLSLNVITIS